MFSDVKINVLLGAVLSDLGFHVLQRGRMDLCCNCVLRAIQNDREWEKLIDRTIQ